MKKVALLSLALVLALGSLGIGYAMWSDTVTISGSVATGRVSVGFICPWTQLDTEVPSPPYTLDEGADVGDFDWNAQQEGPGNPFVTPPIPAFYDDPIEKEKNVGWTVINCGAGPPIKEVTLEFKNVYPCYFNHLSFGIKNHGTIPVRLDHVVFTPENGPPQTLHANGYLTFDLSGNGIDDFELFWGDNFGSQLPPGDKWSMDFDVHFMQDEGIDFTQPHTFTLDVEIFAVQWNEYPMP